MASRPASITASAANPGHDTVADWADSGLITLTGHADGPPLVPPGRAATRARELSGAIAAATGGKVQLDGAQILAERAAFTGHTRRGRISVGGSCRLLPTSDGWAAVSCARPDDPLLIGALIGAELPADPWPAVAAWLREQSGDALADRATLLGIAAAPIRPRTSASMPAELPAGRSVDGALVVDFSALWAGPLCAHLLGVAGARVIKVETPHRPDGARAGNPAFYRLLHAGHRSVVLDPSQPAGRRALEALVDAADIVIEASRPRALAGFGLDAHACVAEGTTWVSITAAGRASDRVGFGDDIAAAAGLVAQDATGAPVFCGDAIADPLTGLTAAALTLTTPAGALLDISMTDVVAATLAPPVAGPAPAARQHDGRWVLDLGTGPVDITAPRRRTPTGATPRPGADTAAVLRELGISAP